MPAYKSYLVSELELEHTLCLFFLKLHCFNRIVIWQMKYGILILDNWCKYGFLGISELDITQIPKIDGVV